MIQLLSQHSIQINKEFKYFLSKKVETPYLSQEIVSYACEIFRIYTPMKERSFLLYMIADAYDIELDKITSYALGVEMIFASYYAKDDIIDSIHKLDFAKRILICDFLNEQGHLLIRDYSTIVEGFLNLVKGQFLSECFESITEMINIKPILIPYYKAGSLFESMIDVFKPFIQNKYLSDFLLLKEISRDIGTWLQIKNDIQDFLININIEEENLILRRKKVLEDLLQGKFNYVLAMSARKRELVTILNRYWKSDLDVTDELQDLVFSVLEEENIISLCIVELENIITQIIHKAKLLNNELIKEEIIKYEKEILQIYN